MGKKYNAGVKIAPAVESEIVFFFSAYEGIKPSRAKAIKQGNKALAQVEQDGRKDRPSNHKMSSDKRGRRPVIVAEVNSEVSMIVDEETLNHLTITADWAGYWKGGKGRNAKTELLAAVGSRTIKAVHLYPAESGIAVPTQLALGVGYSEEELGLFLEALDFEYNSGYGNQELDGTIWFEDGTWMTRREYDGSESWEKHQQPELPEICR